MTALAKKNMKAYNSTDSNSLEHSSKESFHFLQFRNNSAEKARKKRQLNLDYQKFKEQEEEKFRNRFADKKRQSGHTQITMQAQIGKELDTGVRMAYTTQTDKKHSDRETLDNVNGGLESSQSGGIEKLIIDKISGLQNSIEELKSFKQDGSHFPANPYNRLDTLDVNLPGQRRYMMETSGQRHPYLTQTSYDGYNERVVLPVPQTQSVNSTGLVDEAEKKLQELEALLSMLRGGEGYPAAPKMPVYPDTRSPQEKSSFNVTGKVGGSIVDNFEGETRKNKQNLNEYALELQKQIEDGKRRKEEQRQLELEADRKKEKEMALYDQFGHKLLNESSDALKRTEESILQDSVKSGFSTVPGNVSTFARGGNGVFGQPLTQAQKEESERYRKELEEQIAERRKREQEEKERQEEEDKRELERIEVERKKMAEELAAEKLKSSQQCRVFEFDPQVSSPEPEHIPEKKPKSPRNYSACLQTQPIQERVNPPRKLNIESKVMHKDFSDESVLSSEPETLPKRNTKSPRKHSVCLQTQLMQERRPPPRKVDIESKVTQKDFPNEPLLLVGDSRAIISQIKRLKAELVAEKRRIAALEILPEPDVQVFDPRSVFAPIKAPPDESLSRPMKISRPKFHSKGIVRQPMVFRMDGSELQPLRPVRPLLKGYPDSTDSPRRPLKSNRLAPIIRRRSNESLQIDNISSFVQLPYRHPERYFKDAMVRSPSLGSLNLDELTYRNHQRLKKLGDLNYSLEDSEEVLREFLSQEEARQRTQRVGITKDAEL